MCVCMFMCLFGACADVRRYVISFVFLHRHHLTVHTDTCSPSVFDIYPYHPLTLRVDCYLYPCFRAINFRPSAGRWYIKSLGRNNWVVGDTEFQFGQADDVPLVGDIVGDGVRACVFRPSNGGWYCKAAGKNSWGATPAPPDGASLPQYRDGEFQFGKSQDCPIISNVLGHGTRAVILRPTSKNWFFKCKGGNNWSSVQDNIVANIANSATPNPSPTHRPYLRVVNTPFWPLNYRPFLNSQCTDFVTFVDMTTYIWYVNINPTRV